MVFDFLLWQGLVVGYVIVYYRAQKFIELLVGSDVFKGYAFNGEAVVFLHVFSFLFGYFYLVFVLPLCTTEYTVMSFQCPAEFRRVIRKDITFLEVKSEFLFLLLPVCRVVNQCFRLYLDTQSFKLHDGQFVKLTGQYGRFILHPGWHSFKQ